jgi:hypothetical protein
MQVIITLSETEKELARQSAAWMINQANKNDESYKQDQIDIEDFIL